MRKLEDREVDYIRWQNYAFQFYLASRLLCLEPGELWSAAVFCGQQALEDLLKATLVYHNRGFAPKEAGHDIKRMLTMVKEQVPKGSEADIPPYFFFDRRYQEASRYPREDGVGFAIPATFLEDLDLSFAAILGLVPFHFNSELVHSLRMQDKQTELEKAHCAILKRNNQEITTIRKAVERFL
ncbi:MAG: HEPN domain-containing protein [Planctomycetota bacterium]